MTTISIEDLFRGLDDVLQNCLWDLGNGRSGTQVARDHLEPVLGRLEANAGISLDPVYVAYMLIFAREKANREHALKN